MLHLCQKICQYIVFGSQILTLALTVTLNNKKAFKTIVFYTIKKKYIYINTFKSSSLKRNDTVKAFCCIKQYPWVLFCRFCWKSSQCQRSKGLSGLHGIVSMSFKHSAAAPFEQNTCLSWQWWLLYTVTTTVEFQELGNDYIFKYKYCSECVLN